MPAPVANGLRGTEAELDAMYHAENALIVREPRSSEIVPWTVKSVSKIDAGVELFDYPTRIPQPRPPLPRGARET